MAWLTVGRLAEVSCARSRSDGSRTPSGSPAETINCSIWPAISSAATGSLSRCPADARKALEYGLVNEVVPGEELIARGFAIADHIMTQPRTIRRLTTQIVRRPWKRRVMEDLDGGFGIQMFGHVASRHSVHGGEHIRATVDYVREGRKNNFDGRGAPGGA